MRVQRHKNFVHILLKFRSYSVAISGDVSKMYRAVQLHEKDRIYIDISGEQIHQDLGYRNNLGFPCVM